MLSWDEYDDNPDKAPPPPIAQETAQAIIYKESENNVPQPSIAPWKVVQCLSPRFLCRQWRVMKGLV